MWIQSRNNLLKIFYVIIIVLFVSKIVCGYNLRDSFLNRGNSHTFLNKLAFNLVDHNEFSINAGTPSVDYEPLYPWLMSAAYSISGAGWLALTIIQALLHSITSFMIYMLAKKMWNETAGFFAGLFHAFYPYFFTYSLSIYDTTLFVFLVFMTIWILLRDKLSMKHFILSGIFTGLAFLTRGTMIVFLIPLLVYCFYIVWKKKNITQAVIACTVIIGMNIITQLPWLMRNKNLTGQFMISTHGPFGFWQGNNDYSYEYLSKNISLDEIYRRNPPPEIYRKYPMKSREPKEAVAVAGEFQKEAVEWIKTHPQDFIKLAFLKVQKLWTWNRNPASSNLAYGTNEGREIVHKISYLPLLLLSPIGLFFLWKKNIPAALLIIGIVCCFTGAHAIVMGFTRARLPLDPLLMILTGIAVAGFSERFSNHKLIKG